MNDGPPLNDFLHQSFDMDEFLSISLQKRDKTLFFLSIYCTLFTCILISMEFD